MSRASMLDEHGEVIWHITHWSVRCLGFDSHLALPISLQASWSEEL